MRSIAIDIDNTLWDFAPVFYERLKRINPDVPPPSGWTDWDFWKPYVKGSLLYDVIHEVHLRQEEYPPYPQARPFLVALKKEGYHIIIASHRRRGARDATLRWLLGNDLPFDELHLSFDKSVLFGDCWGLVDDSPVMLEKARRAGLVRAGLLNPWNAGTGHPLFGSLEEVLEYLDGQWVGERRGSTGE